MDNIEEDVKYFVELVKSNIEKAKSKKGGKVQTVFNCLNVSKDGQGVLVYNIEKDYGYELWKKDIQKHKSEDEYTWLGVQVIALRYIERLYKYDKKEIDFEELAGIPKPIPEVVKNILKQKNNISEQLKLLRSNRKIPEVDIYVENIYNDKHATDYLKYLIDKYYYNKKDLVKPEKNGLEKEWKMLLRWD